jgi:hypothetical protein
MDDNFIWYNNFEFSTENDIFGDSDEEFQEELDVADFAVLSVEDDNQSSGENTDESENENRDDNEGKIFFEMIQLFMQRMKNHIIIG